MTTQQLLNKLRLRLIEQMNTLDAYQTKVHEHTPADPQDIKKMYQWQGRVDETIDTITDLEKDAEYEASDDDIQYTPYR